MSITLDGTNGITSPDVVTNDGQVYAKENILGTVSESGGVPTGAIIERGSNANGEFVKYADGTMVAWNTDVTGAEVIINEADGNVFVSSPIAYTPASEFSGFYYVTSGSDGARNWGGGSPTSGASVSFRLFRATTTISFRAKAMAIGRWF